jgi:hypothetical protein
MNSKNGLHEKVAILPDAIARRMGDETVILHLGSGTYFGLEEVGSRIWDLIAEEKSLAEICDILLGEYQVSRHLLERDIAVLIEDLLARDLIAKS